MVATRTLDDLARSGPEVVKKSSTTSSEDARTQVCVRGWVVQLNERAFACKGEHSEPWRQQDSR